VISGPFIGANRIRDLPLVTIAPRYHLDSGCNPNNQGNETMKKQIAIAMFAFLGLAVQFASANTQFPNVRVNTIIADAGSGRAYAQITTPQNQYLVNVGCNLSTDVGRAQWDLIQIAYTTGKNITAVVYENNYGNGSNLSLQNIWIQLP
jgi:hypothetical protein